MLELISERLLRNGNADHSLLVRGSIFMAVDGICMEQKTIKFIYRSCFIPSITCTEPIPTHGLIDRLFTVFPRKDGNRKRSSKIGGYPTYLMLTYLKRKVMSRYFAKYILYNMY